MDDASSGYGSQPSAGYAMMPANRGDNLADVLERVLDKGIVVAGDVVVNLLDIELLTIKVRLLIASVDKAREIGIDWWEADPALSSKARQLREDDGLGRRVARLEEILAGMALPEGDEAEGGGSEEPRHGSG